MRAEPPRPYDMADGEYDSDDGLSSLATGDATTPEPEDLLPPQPPTPLVGQPPPLRQESGGMVDSTKRDAPTDDGPTQWSPTGDGGHGPRAWRRNDSGEQDGDGRPPRNRRRTEEGEEATARAKEEEARERQLEAQECAGKLRDLEQQIEQMRQRHQLLAQQQQQIQAASASSGVDAGSLAAAQTQVVLDHQQLEAEATAVASERLRLRITELRASAAVNGAVIPEGFYGYT